MKALSVLLRILSSLGLAGLSFVLWMKWDVQKKQSQTFLDETVDNAYGILQSEKEAQWKDISNKKSVFNDIFEANEQIGMDDENLLENAAEALRVSEDAILRDKDYRENLDLLTKEFGADSLFWDSESKKWKITNGVKLESPAGLKDPFQNLTEFPKEDVKNEDGTVTKGVSRQNRLRTVIGMFYKDRQDKFTEISNLRGKIVNRDKELREFQNLFSREQETRKSFEDQVSDLTVKLKGVEADLEFEKKEALAYKEGMTLKIAEFEDQVAKTQREIQNNEKKFNVTIEEMNEDHKRELSQANSKLVKEYQRGREEATEEFMAKQSGGEVPDAIGDEVENPFIVESDAPPVFSQAELIAANQTSEISDIGAPSTIARIDSGTGMILLPLGAERGVSQGNVFTIWKDQRRAARIRVQSAKKGFLLAYILPHFGTPNKLRPGDNVHIVPDEEETL